MLQPSHLESLLKQACTVSQALQTLHAHHCTHGSLHPQALHFQPDGSLRLRPPKPGASLPLELLRYTSPEQAGCLMPADARSDLYSFGLILYEWLLERPAFTCNDPLQLAYQQIAVLPVPPHQLDPELPAPLSALVMRLLAKPPEARYASAQGLADDLQHCLQQWTSRGRLEPFALGRTDSHALFALPERLYGRADAMASLLRLWRGVARGGVQLCLVAAAAGMGKTALVRALRDSVLGSGGMLVEGGFVPSRRNQPYSALLDALRKLLRQVLAGAQADRARWRARLQTSLGARVQSVWELLPELEWIANGQRPHSDSPSTATPTAIPASVLSADPDHGPMPPPGGPALLQQRHAVLLDLLALFAGPEQPLLLFLDNLQNADMASLALVHALLRDRRGSHLLLVGAYRHDALPTDAPMTRLLAALRKDRVDLSEIRLEPLDAEELAALIDDSCFHIQAVSTLAAWVMQETGGNPQRVRERLTTLVQQGRLRYERRNRAWCWTADDTPVDHAAALAPLWLK